MADRVRMISKTVFQNDRVTVYREDGPDEGEPGRTVTVGDRFMTDVLHGKELARLGHAEPYGWSLDEVEDPPLEAHHQVSAGQLAADRAHRGKKSHGGATAAARPTDTERPLPLTGTVPVNEGPHDAPGAAAVQANRADGLAPVAQPAAPAAAAPAAQAPAAAAPAAPAPAVVTPAKPVAAKAS